MESDPRGWKIHRGKRGRIRWYQRWLEAWWIVTGKWSLHRAWQGGHHHGTQIEYRRLITNHAYLAEARVPAAALEIISANMRKETPHV